MYPTIDVMYVLQILCKSSFLMYVKFNTVNTPVSSRLFPCLDWHAAAYVCHHHLLIRGKVDYLLCNTHTRVHKGLTAIFQSEILNMNAENTTGCCNKLV